MSSITIRSFQEHDQSSVEELYRHGFDLYKDFCPEIHMLTNWFIEDKLVEGGDMKSIYAHYIQNPQNHFWVAEKDGGIVGFVGGILGDGEMSSSSGASDEATLPLPDSNPHIELLRMCVSASVRGEGVAAMLLDTLSAYGKERGSR